MSPFIMLKNHNEWFVKSHGMAKSEENQSNNAIHLIHDGQSTQSQNVEETKKD